MISTKQGLSQLILKQDSDGKLWVNCKDLQTLTTRSVIHIHLGEEEFHIFQYASYGLSLCLHDCMA